MGGDGLYDPQFVKLAERLEQLPRAKQKLVAEMLEGVLRQAS